MYIQRRRALRELCVGFDSIISCVREEFDDGSASCVGRTFSHGNSVCIQGASEQRHQCVSAFQKDRRTETVHAFRNLYMNNSKSNRLYSRGPSSGGYGAHIRGTLTYGQFGVKGNEQ